MGKDSPMPSPQILPTKAVKNLQDEHGTFKMPNTPVLTGRTDAVASDGFDSPSIQFADRTISSMADQKGGKSSMFSPQVKRQSLFGSPNGGAIASNFKKAVDANGNQIPEEEAKRDEGNRKNDHLNTLFQIKFQLIFEIKYFNKTKNAIN